MIRTIVIVLLLASLIPASSAHHTFDGYWGPQYAYYYPDSYLTPARTGLPSKAYFYPNRYISTNGWFRGYLSYTHASYRHPGVMYAQPYPTYRLG